ncbi:MAG: hypothetical protein DIJKHBIC_00149 [Thermoanaerobaculia bacterium]|nr:hypothetical protein [Thermoanaerobaculia bacterium]
MVHFQRTKQGHGRHLNPSRAMAVVLLWLATVAPDAGAQTVLLSDNFNTISGSTWQGNSYYTVSSGVLQCVGPQRSSICELDTIQTFSPPLRISSRMKISGGCNCGVTEIVFGMSGSSAYRAGLYCDGWGLDCAHIAIEEGLSSPTVLLNSPTPGLGCLSWYDVVITWEATRITVQVTGPAPLGSKTVSYDGDFSRPGRIQLFGYDCDGGSAFDWITVESLVSQCTYSLDPSSSSLPAAGASGRSFQVQSSTGCAWTASSNSSWITITGGASGNGSGAVTYNVASNPGPARTGTITAAGQTFTVFQDGGCSYTLSPSSATAPAVGASGSTLQILTSSGCPWSASSNNSWIRGGTSGSGTGVVTFDVAPNAGAARTGTITAAGQTFSVFQDGGCSYTLSPSSASAPAVGASGLTFQILTSTSCAWSASSNNSWITLRGGTSGSGTGVVTFDVAPNSGSARSGTISAGGQTFTVSQASPGPPCRRGDVNGNGSVSALDASLVLQAVVGAIVLDTTQTCAADFNQNGSVTALDASLILQCIVTSTCP